MLMSTLRLGQKSSVDAHTMEQSINIFFIIVEEDLKELQAPWSQLMVA